MIASLFGPLKVEVDGVCLGPDDFHGAKPRQLLEILLVQRGRALTKDRLCELLWEESLPNNPKATLENYVSILRRQLDPGIIATVSGGYRIVSDRVDLDLDHFDGLFARGSVDGYRGALRLVRGDVLEGEPAGWARRIRERYRQRHLDALLELAWAALQESDADTAEVLAEEALQLDLAAERAYAVLMLAAYARDRYSKALRLANACREAMALEFGADPSPWFEQLHRSLLEGVDSAAVLAAATG
ncbi:MAG TPA: BTAD domain-containing putative transcriptional regulator [Candidatus Dormibacteraeota bacterium]